MRDRKGSEIETTDRIPLSHKFISITGRWGWHSLFRINFLNFLPSHSKFLNLLQNSRRFSEEHHKFLRTWDFFVLSSQLLATFTQQLQEPNVSGPQQSYFQEAALLKPDLPCKRMQWMTSAIRLLFLGSIPHEQALAQILFTQTQFPWVYACRYPQSQINNRILNTLCAWNWRVSIWGLVPFH